MNKVVLPNEVMLGEVGRLLKEGRRVVILTKGGSMRPFIRGDRDSVSLELRGDVAVGDVVLARLGTGHYVLHRVAARDGDTLTLHGDGNLQGVERCSVGDVMGTAVEIIRPSGRKRDCICAASKRAARRWNRLPVLMRRLCLGIDRRIVK